MNLKYTTTMTTNFKTWAKQQISFLKRISFSHKEIKRFIKMSYNEYESKNCSHAPPPVIIMHCIMGSKRNWHEVGKELAQKTKRNIITVDARNHGQSPFTPDHGSKVLAQDVLEFVKAKHYHKVALMGHGMGGRAMMFFALKCPSYVERAIIIDISPVAIPQDYLCLDQIFLLMKGVEIPMKHTLAEGRQMISEVFKKITTVEENAEFLAMNLQKNWKGEFYWSLNIDALRLNLRKFSQFMSHMGGVKPFEGPAMFICGKDSNFVEPDSISSIITLFPKSELHWLDAGHLVQMDQPKQFMDLIIQFLNK